MYGLLERWLLKKRIILAMQGPSYTRRPTQSPQYTVQRLDAAPDGRQAGDATYRFLDAHVGEDRVVSRLNRAGCAAFVATDNLTADPVGFYWAVASAGQGIWHDKLPIAAGSGLAFHGYVAATHRRRGVYTLLQGAVHNHLLVERQCDVVFTIVESANLASLRANERFGLRPVSTNYLVKFLKRNVLSVYRSESGCQVFFVAAGAASASL